MARIENGRSMGEFKLSRGAKRLIEEASRLDVDHTEALANAAASCSGPKVGLFGPAERYLSPLRDAVNLARDMKRYPQFYRNGDEKF